MHDPVAHPREFRAAVVVFPGSNCDRDAAHAFADVLDVEADLVWHQHDDLTPYDCVVLPGGFSYGDHLRCGAMASTSPVMHAVRHRAADGAFVLGICNGFQVLTESGLLPGALLANDHLQFRCAQTTVRVETTDTPFTGSYLAGELLQLPIAHGDGNYYADELTLQRLRDNDQVVFTYAGDNPNGSLADIAGICNEQRNVLGMMPHPERAVSDMLGSADGAGLFRSILESWEAAHVSRSA